MLAIGNVDAYASSNNTSPYVTVLSTAGNAWDGSYTYFHLQGGATNSITRTQQFTVGSAGTYTYYLRGYGNTSMDFWRPQLTLLYVPD